MKPLPRVEKWNKKLTAKCHKCGYQDRDNGNQENTQNTSNFSEKN
jgi:hypothetical protein